LKYVRGCEICDIIGNDGETLSSHFPFLSDWKYWFALLLS
jgi:hypothetical protein